MPQQNLRRLVETWNIVANSEKTFDLPKVQDYETIMLELDAVVTLSVAGTAVRAHAPAQLVKTVDFVADGKDVLDSVPFYMAVFGNYKRAFSKEVTAPANATAIAHTVRAVAFLDRANINGWRPKDSLFQAANAKLLQLRITTGLATDLFTGTPTGVVTSGTVKVYVQSVAEQEKPNGATDEGEPKLVLKRTKQQVVYTAANSAYRILLPVGNYVRLVQYAAKDSGEPSDTIVLNNKLYIDGVDVRHAMGHKITRSINAADQNVPIGDVPTGMAVIDSSPRGKLSDYYDLRNSSEAVLELDLAAATAGIVDVVVEEFIAPRG